LGKCGIWHYGQEREEKQDNARTQLGKQRYLYMAMLFELIDLNGKVKGSGDHEETLQVDSGFDAMRSYSGLGLIVIKLDIQ
jgi:hypothetical protein